MLALSNHVIDWIHQWWWPCMAGLLWLLMLLGWSPVSYQPETHTLTRLFIMLRNSTLTVFVIVAIGVPLLGYVMWVHEFNSRAHLFWQWLLQGSWQHALLVASAMLVGFLLRFLYQRHWLPYWSDIKRQYRIRLTTDTLSDVRSEKGQYQHRRFNPVDYYQVGRIFLGLNTQQQPVTVDLPDWLESNMQIVGPTRFGKGILLGVLLDQAIRLGNTVFYIDPKGDQYLPHIMADTASACGRHFIYVDLNDDGVGGYHPFVGGDARSRRARLLTAFGLHDTGEQADFYKGRERKIIDNVLFPLTSKVSGMRAFFEDKQHDYLQNDAQRLYSGLVEWSSVQSLSPKGHGLRIETSILNNAVVYVKGSLDDKVVQAATRILIMEVIQEAKRLQAQRQHHLTLAIDELRFLTSNAVIDASATCLGFRLNMLLAYQSKKDIRNLEDITINASAAETSINTNCQLKFLYGTQDTETAQWASEMGGTQQKLVTNHEHISVGQLGQETWETYRSVGKQAEDYITRNTMLSLEKRAGVFFQPSVLPEVVFTSFVATTAEHEFTQQHYLNPSMSTDSNATVDEEDGQSHTASVDVQPSD